MTTIRDTGPGIPKEILLAHLRPVLHDERRRQRHRSGPRDRLWNRDLEHGGGIQVANAPEGGALIFTEITLGCRPWLTVEAATLGLTCPVDHLA